MRIAVAAATLSGRVFIVAISDQQRSVNNLRSQVIGIITSSTIVDDRLATNPPLVRRLHTIQFTVR